MMQKDIKKLNAHEYSITIDIPQETVTKEVSLVTSMMGENLTISGFRKGKAPQDMVIRSVGEEKIKEELIQRLLGTSLYQVLQEEKIVPVINPKVENMEVSLTGPLKFTTIITTYPEVKISGYDKIKVKKDPAKEVTDVEIDQVVDNLYKQITNPEERENLMYDASGKKLSLGKKVDAAPDDLFAKKMGATDLKDLREKIKANLTAETQTNAERDWETKILEELVKKTKVDLPEALIEAEVDNILKKVVYDFSSMGMSFEDYLKSQNKTTEELRKDYRESAVKTLSAQLALNEIAKMEKLEVTDPEVEAALPKEESGHVHSSSEKAQMYSWLIQRKALAYLKEGQN
jgi:FKBP-type peptidyl-prolyl cis-trans isomerase (trigger factor)